MSTVNLYFNLESYDDSSTTVVPVLKEFDWTREIKNITSSKVDVITRSCIGGIAGAATTIQLPDTAITLLYIEADGGIYVRLNGDAGDTNILTSSAVGTMDAVYFKRGTVSSLVIFNPGTAAVNVKIMMGV